MCRALFWVSSTLALWSHPTAEVLSPKASMQERGGVESCSSSSQMVITAARNSSRLFFDETEARRLSGIFHLHAAPDDTEYPPNPFGQASENTMLDGLR